jgi:anti-anti-sigma factor
MAPFVPDGAAEPSPHLRAGLDVTATVAGHDGTVLCRVTRSRERTSTGPVHRHELIVVSVDGDLDADTSPLLHLALTQALDGVQEVCCDLSGVAFFGAAGANTILAAHLHATATGRRFTVRGVQQNTRRVLAVTGLDAVLTITATRSPVLDERGVP